MSTPHLPLLDPFEQSDGTRPVIRIHVEFGSGVFSSPEQQGVSRFDFFRKELKVILVCIFLQMNIITPCDRKCDKELVNTRHRRGTGSY